jgi:predicted acyltransferase
MSAAQASPQRQQSAERFPAKPQSERLMCLDIYRGLMVAAMIVVDNPGSDDKAYWAIKHAEWNGWTPADFIFPSHSRLGFVEANRAARFCCTPLKEAWF